MASEVSGEDGRAVFPAPPDGRRLADARSIPPAPGQLTTPPDGRRLADARSIPPAPGPLTTPPDGRRLADARSIPPAPAHHPHPCPCDRNVHLANVLVT